MARFIYIPGLAGSILGIARGGTGASSAEGAAETLNVVSRTQIGQINGVAGLDHHQRLMNPLDYTYIYNKPVTLEGYGILDAVAKSTKNQPNGYAGLDGNGWLSESVFGPNSGAGSAGIIGPTVLYISQTGTYTITNYDSFRNYTLTAINGSVSRVGDTITYTAPAVEGMGGFIINGRNINIAINASGINTPVIVSPANGTIAASSTPTIQSSVFSYVGAAQTHSESRWEVSTSSNFATLAASYEGAANLITWTVSPALTPGVTYYVRVRHRSNTGSWSNWSTPISFSITTVSTWLTTIGDAGDDFFNDITRDEEGNIYATGSYSDGSSSKPYLVKCNSNGDVIWQRRINTAPAIGNTVCLNITTDNFNNIYMLIFGVSDPSYFWVYKLSNSGLVLWNKRITNQIPITIYYGFGRSGADLTTIAFNNGAIYITNSGKIIKMGLDGTIITSKFIKIMTGFDPYGQYNAPIEYYNYFFPHRMLFDNSGNIIISGITVNNSSGTGLGTYISHATIAKFDSDCNVIWVRHSTYNQSFDTVTLDEFGNIYTGGSMVSLLTNAGNNGMTGGYMVFTKYSISGTLLWQKYLNNPKTNGSGEELPGVFRYSVQNNTIKACMNTSDGILFAGHYNTTAHNSEILLIKINKNDGTIVNQYKIASTGNDFISTGFAYNSNAMVLTGFTVNPSIGTYRGLIMVVPAHMNITEGIFVNSTYLSVYSTFYSLENYTPTMTTMPIATTDITLVVTTPTNDTVDNVAASIERSPY